jgi:hypothetical protein
VVIPPEHGAGWQRTFPAQTVIVDDSSGHLEDLDAVSRSLQWLVEHG